MCLYIVYAFSAYELATNGSLLRQNHTSHSIGNRDMLFCHGILEKPNAIAMIFASFSSILSTFVFSVNRIRKCTLWLCSPSSMHSQSLHVPVNRACFLCIWTRSKWVCTSSKPHFSQSKAVVTRGRFTLQRILRHGMFCNLRWVEVMHIFIWLKWFPSRDIFVAKPLYGRTPWQGWFFDITLVWVDYLAV